MSLSTSAQAKYDEARAEAAASSSEVDRLTAQLAAARHETRDLHQQVASLTQQARAALTAEAVFYCDQQALQSFDSQTFMFHPLTSDRMHALPDITAVHTLAIPFWELSLACDLPCPCSSWQHVSDSSSQLITAACWRSVLGWRHPGPVFSLSRVQLPGPQVTDTEAKLAAEATEGERARSQAAALRKELTGMKAALDGTAADLAAERASSDASAPSPVAHIDAYKAGRLI